MSNDDQSDGIIRSPGSHKVRNGHGQYTRALETAERDAEAARMRGLGYSYLRIGAELGMTKQSAHEAVQRVLRETVQEAGDELRAILLQRLDDELTTLADLETTVRELLEKQHVTVSQGQVVINKATNEPVEDDAFVLNVVARLQQIAEQRRRCDESRRKLLGTDQPPKLEVSGGIKYEIVGIDPADLT